MKKLIYALLLGLLIFSACSTAPAAQEPTAPAHAEPAATVADSAQPQIIVVDALGREVTLSHPPARIVVTGRGFTLILDAVYMFPEAPARIAAMGDSNQGNGNFISRIDPGFDQKMILQTDAGAEQIAAANPDLVIFKSYLAESVGKSVEALHIPVLYVDFETPEQYTRDLAILGKVFQNEARAKELAEYYLNGVGRIQAALEEDIEKPRVLMLYYSEKDGAVAFNVPPLSWIQTRMVELAGGEPVWGSANLSNGWTVVTLEQIAAWDADRIFIISYQKNSAEIAAALKSDPQWQALRAVKQNHLYGFPADFYSWDQSDSRWILGLSWLAAQLHPKSFPQYDPLAEVQQFYQQMYGLNAEFVAAEIQPVFRGDLP
ncbi:MAG: ABC transporter substrate-binding protein [Anaerolineae bacterium]|nr:ABC transporter substrate-binding protein [Anaerolineae bacterium]